MKRLFHLMIVAIAAVCVVSGCQKYDDSDLRKQIQELREKLASLEAWCSSSQSAIDAVAVLQKAVENMNSVESIDPFIDADGATGYVITFTNKKTIKLYNGQNGKDGDAFFGNVVVNDDCIIFTLKDGRTFTVPRKQDNNNYLAFEAVEPGATVSLEIIGEVEAPSLKYSTNKLDWIDFDFSNPVTITLENVGDKVYWRNAGKTDHFSKDNENYVHFVLGDKKIAAEGNIMSLVDSSCVSLIIPTDWCFKALFHECASLTRAPELPATELTLACYSDMFRDCTSLEEAPELPGTEMADSCYYGMFYNCASLVKAPELPSIDLAESCYSNMFLYCTSLKAAPVLPATHLTYGCYWGMFAGCESLEKAPELSSTELAPFCYANMFEDCCSITEAPELPATELAENCYLFMFGFCTSLKEAPVLPATKLAEACYRNMFRYCTSLKEAPVLPATKLAKDCYYLMFYLCYSLEAAPDLPSDELAVNCYAGMFFECLSLESAPYLPAEKLVSGCYDSMFRDCPNLKSIKVAFTDWADGTATPDWVSGVVAEGNFECPESLEVKYGKDYIPTGWSVNGAVPVSATKSVAEPAAKSISGSLCNSPASKTLKIQNRLDGRGMITL